MQYSMCWWISLKEMPPSSALEGIVFKEGKNRFFRRFLKKRILVYDESSKCLRYYTPQRSLKGTLYLHDILSYLNELLHSFPICLLVYIHMIFIWYYVTKWCLFLLLLLECVNGCFVWLFDYNEDILVITPGRSNRDDGKNCTFEITVPGRICMCCFFKDRLDLLLHCIIINHFSLQMYFTSILYKIQRNGLGSFLESLTSLGGRYIQINMLEWHCN